MPETPFVLNLEPMQTAGGPVLVSVLLDEPDHLTDLLGVLTFASTRQYELFKAGLGPLAHEVTTAGADGETSDLLDEVARLADQLEGDWSGSAWDGLD